MNSIDDLLALFVVVGATQASQCLSLHQHDTRHTIDNPIEIVGTTFEIGRDVSLAILTDTDFRHHVLQTIIALKSGTLTSHLVLVAYPKTAVILHGIGITIVASRDCIIADCQVGAVGIAIEVMDCRIFTVVTRAELNFEDALVAVARIKDSVLGIKSCPSASNQILLFEAIADHVAVGETVVLLLRNRLPIGNHL